MKPSFTPRIWQIASDSPVSTAWITYSTGARNMKLNSIGSVTPVRNDVSAIENSRPPTIARRSFGASCSIARHAAGRPNIMIGKKPAMKVPAVGSPAKKRCRSPCTISPPAGGVKLPNTNHASELMMWCRPVTSSRRFRKPNTNAPIAPAVVSHWPAASIACWIGCQTYPNAMPSITQTSPVMIGTNRLPPKNAR